MPKVAAPVRRNMLERTDDGDGLASGSTHTILTAADLRYDYGQVDQASREGVIAAALDIRIHAARAKDSMIKIGLKLSSVKGLLPHGQFGDWCATEFEMSQKTAERMMRAAEVFGSKIDTVSILSDSAMYLLSGPAVAEATREEIVIEAQATGKSPTKARVQAVIKAQTLPAARTLTLDETIAVIWRLLKHGCAGEQRPEKLKNILATRTKSEDYRHVCTGDVTLDAAVFDRAWHTVEAELDGRMAHNARLATQKAPAPTTISLTFALLGDEAERKAQSDWFKNIEGTTLAAYMQALYQTNGELV